MLTIVFRPGFDVNLKVPEGEVLKKLSRYAHPATFLAGR
jgi:hypothetical protein